jgi:RimJ/RimL family protein N-acetyltransferase
MNGARIVTGPVTVDPIETLRLTLRLPQMHDAGPMLEIHQDPAVVQYVLLGNAQGGLTAAWRSVAMMVGHWHLRGYGQWTVVERATGVVVGRVGLWYPEGWPGVELGWIIRRERWGQGLATEAAEAALAWAWTHVDTDHIISIIAPDNHRSIRVAEKIGESFERSELVSGVRSSIYGVHRPPST